VIAENSLKWIFSENDMAENKTARTRVRAVH